MQRREGESSTAGSHVTLSLMRSGPLIVLRKHLEQIKMHPCQAPADLLCVLLGWYLFQGLPC